MAVKGVGEGTPIKKWGHLSRILLIKLIIAFGLFLRWGGLHEVGIHKVISYTKHIIYNKVKCHTLC